MTSATATPPVVGASPSFVVATSVYPEKPKGSVTGQPAAMSRRSTRSVSSGEGISSVSLVIATRTSVPSTGVCPVDINSVATATTSSSDKRRRSSANRGCSHSWERLRGSPPEGRPQSVQANRIAAWCPLIANRPAIKLVPWTARATSSIIRKDRFMTISRTPVPWVYAVLGGR